MKNTRGDKAHDFALKIMGNDDIGIGALSDAEKRKEIAKAAFDMVDAMEKEGNKRYPNYIGYMGPY